MGKLYDFPGERDDSEFLGDPAQVTELPRPSRRRMARLEGTRSEDSWLRQTRPRHGWILGTIGFAVYLVRAALFLVLLWLRVPVVLVCEFISIPMMFCWLFAWYAFPDKKLMIWAFAGTSFAAFAVMWFYDVLLMALSPRDMVKMI